MSALRHEVRVFFTALMFFTRIPCPAWVDHSEEYLNQSSRYFAAIGLVVGGIATLLFVPAQLLWGGWLAALLSTFATLVATGAFHEDGFADTLDGFGGGWTVEDKLRIMKDSRLGTYGAVGLMLLLLIKVVALAQLPLWWATLGLLSAHSLSRWFAASIITSSTYVTAKDAKSKPLATSLPWSQLSISFIWPLLPLVALSWLAGLWVLLSLPLLLLLRMYLLGWYQRQLGGYTGDCLGAAQQLNEACFYLLLLALWNLSSSGILPSALP